MAGSGVSVHILGLLLGSILVSDLNLSYSDFFVNTFFVLFFVCSLRSPLFTLKIQQIFGQKKKAGRLGKSLPGSSQPRTLQILSCEKGESGL